MYSTSKALLTGAIALVLVSPVLALISAVPPHRTRSRCGISTSGPMARACPGQRYGGAGKTGIRRECAACHGDAGVGGIKDRLVGGQGTLGVGRTAETVGSFWPYATTLFDYVHRAMPYQAPGSLSDDDTYAVAAYF